MKALFQTINKVFVLAACFFTFSLVAGKFSLTYAFPDIGSSPYQDSILSLSELGVVQGYPNGDFGPNNNLTRAEMMKIILETVYENDFTATENNCFPDVTDDRYAEYVCYGKNNNIVRGYPDGNFKPENTVTIAEGLKITLESFNIPVQEGTGRFWYQPYVDFAHNNNLLSQYAINPETPMSRELMAHIAHQLYLDMKGIAALPGERNNRSTGCFKPQPPTQPITTTVADGVTRNMITVIGDKYNHVVPSKFVIAFHGRTNSNRQVQGYYGLDRATAGDAIIVYPAGLPEGGPSRRWNTNFAIFDSIVDTFSENYCIDLDEIYVVGHSLGAWYTNSLACARGDKIRAIGSVGGGTTINDCSGPVAAMIMHHPDDNLAPFSTGITARNQLLSQNHCGEATRPVGPERGNCVEYTDCLPGNPVIWCEHTESQGRNGAYYPHNRPRRAGNEIRNFFLSLAYWIE